MSPLEMVAIGFSFDIQKPPMVGFDWLCGQVAMVKVVIKAIKAAGVGLNRNCDCLCCHKLKRNGDIKQERMGKTSEVKNNTKKQEKNSSVGEKNIIIHAKSKTGSHLGLN